MGTEAAANLTRLKLGELIAEVIAAFIILGIGDSVAAMYVLYDPSPYQHAYWGVCIAWGLAVTLAIYVTGAVSGCHANPAVTLALTLIPRLPREESPALCAGAGCRGVPGRGARLPAVLASDRSIQRAASSDARY